MIQSRTLRRRAIHSTNERLCIFVTERKFLGGENYGASEGK